jgi:uncharacterized Rmd1/YagE family protein
MSNPGLFPEKTPVRMRALFLGERIDLRNLESNRLLPALPVVINAGERGYAVLFRYGVAVIVNLTPVEEISFVNHLNPLVKDPYSQPEVEEAAFSIDPAGEERVDNNVISLRSSALERLQVVADILAKSVVLAHYESRIAEVFDRIEPLAARLQHTGRGGYKDAELLRHIGGTLLIQHTMVGRVAVEEKPEILWEKPEFERLYIRLEDEYELSERHLALERKLELVSRTAETILDLLQHRRSLRVEWYIVVLIVLEILLSLYNMMVVKP